MNGNKSLYPIWLGVLGVALLAGAIAGVFIFIQGHVLFNANDVLIWTLPLGIYIFLRPDAAVGTAPGLRHQEIRALRQAPGVSCHRDPLRRLRGHRA
jgi:hypothetical protein